MAKKILFAQIGILILVAFFMSCATVPYRPFSPALGDPEAQRKQVLHYLSTMSLQEKIAQRCIIFIPRGMPIEEVEGFIRARKPAGVILYRWNYETLQDLVNLTDAIRRGFPKGYPAPFICADQEGGRVRAFPFREFTQLPSAFQLGLYRDPEVIRAAAYLAAVQMREAGLNMNLAPVLDVVEAGDRSIIGDRSYGTDPVWVAKAGKAFLEGKRQAGVIPVIKHFPGHGGTRIDSHVRLPILTKTKEELSQRDIFPFKKAIKAGAPVVMTAHILYTDLDHQFPATISERIIQGLLREQLGFQGVVLTDGLEMGALSKGFSLKETVYLAFKAGVDILLLYTEYQLEEIVAIVEELIQENRLTEQDIDRGVERVLALKQAYGLLPPINLVP